MKLSQIYKIILTESSVGEYVRKYKSASSNMDYMQFLELDNLGQEVSNLLGDPKYQSMKNDEVRNLLQTTDLKTKVKNALTTKVDNKSSIATEFARAFPNIQNITGKQGNVLNLKKIRKQRNGKYRLETPSNVYPDVELTPEQLNIVQQIISANK